MLLPQHIAGWSRRPSAYTSWGVMVSADWLVVVLKQCGRTRTKSRGLSGREGDVLVELSVMEQRYQPVMAVVQEGWKVTEPAIVTI
jgi:hypothetical protein